ncbi:hypothetical protein GCM10009836_63090 [Pseudonocardia ailaonensis]|uniref:Uncharacterized protein n=1 Tax=Pseudonocardia ailaonensis TaxID=367279 RepID=A0ABN2NKP8_9PSEU
MSPLAQVDHAASGQLRLPGQRPTLFCDGERQSAERTQLTYPAAAMRYTECRLTPLAASRTA